MRIAIAIPSQEQMYAHTAFDLAHLVGDLVEHGSIFHSIPLINPQRARIEIARNTAVTEAMKLNSDYILFLDSDARFPHDTARRLLDRRKDIIGCNASKRDETGMAITHDLLRKKLTKKSEGVTKVKFIGMHTTLIKMSVFDKIPKPWFYANYEKGTGDWRGEDYCFCYEAREVGFPIYCDLDLSKEIGHIGQKTWYI